MATLGISQLLAQIIANIYTNVSNDIDGDTLQYQLTDIVDSLNKSLYNALIPYNVGQAVIIDEGGFKKVYLCVTNTTAGESPITTPAKWELVSVSGISLDYITSNITTLKAITGYSDEDQVLVNSNNGLYYFDAANITVGDDDLIVTPDDITEPAPGRWVKSKTFVDITTTGILGDLTTPVTTTLVFALNALAKSSIEIVDNIDGLQAIPLARRDFKCVIVRYYDEGDEAAGSGGEIKLLIYKGVDFTNSEWEDLNNWIGIESVLTSEIITTATNLEGIPPGTNIPIGTTFEAIFNLFLLPYLAPEISGSTIQDTPSGSIFEVGATIQIDSITIVVNNDSEGNPPINLYIAGVGYNILASVGVNVPTTPPLNVQKTTDTSESWIISGEDKNSIAIDDEIVSVNWLFRHFVGASNTELSPSSTPTEVKAVLDNLQFKILREGKWADITTTSTFAIDGYFTYIAFATKYNTLNTIILNYGIDILGAFTELGDFSYTNAEGHVENYKLYKSNASGAFEEGDELNIL